MGDRNNAWSIQKVSFTLIGLSGINSIRFDFPDASQASLAMLKMEPAFELGMSFGDAVFNLSELMIQPQRLLFTISGAPAQLPIVLRLNSPAPFLFGWLQVPDSVQTVISTAAERVRILGPGYWAVPVFASATVAPVAAQPAPAPIAVPVAKPSPTPPPTTAALSPPPSGKPK